MIEENKQEKNEEYYLPDASRGGHNILANSSFNNSIYKNMLKVKKKFEFFGKIEGLIKTSEKEIIFNSENIYKHFRGKSFREFIYRKKLLGTVFSNIDNLYFESDLIGYFIYKELVIKVVLGKQSNGKYFVKSYYKYDKYTEKYKKYLLEEKKGDIYLLKEEKIKNNFRI